MYGVMYIIIGILVVVVVWVALPHFKWFRKLCGGRWYRIRDRTSPKDDHYWTRFLDEQKSCILDVEDYSDDDLGSM